MVWFVRTLAWWIAPTNLKASSKKTISCQQLHRILEITRKSAWFMTHRIREAIRSRCALDFGNGGGVVEVDETSTGTSAA